MCLQCAVIFFAFKNITLKESLVNLTSQTCAVYFSRTVFRVFASRIHSYIRYLRISLLGWGLLSARFNTRTNSRETTGGSLCWEERSRVLFKHPEIPRTNWLIGLNWLISSARTSNVTERVSCDLVSFNVVWNFLCIILSCTKAFKMAVKRVLQVLRRVTEFKEYVLVTFKEEAERLLSC